MANHHALTAPGLARTCSFLSPQSSPRLTSFHSFPLHHRSRRQAPLRYVTRTCAHLTGANDRSSVRKASRIRFQKDDGDNPIPGFVEFQRKVRWAVLLAYRALLVGGIGFAMVSPAIAESVASPPPAYEVVIENENGQSSESEGKRDLMPQDVDDVSEYKTKITSCAYTLGDEFWKGIALLKGSTEAMLKSVLDKDPASVPALQCLAKRLIDIEDSSRALLVIEKLEALQPETIEWKYMKAEAYDCDGQFESAKQVFEDILKIEPFSSRALQGLIMAMDQLNDTGTALKIAEERMMKAKQENEQIEARNIGILIGQAYTLKGHFAKALKVFKLMVEEDATDFRPHLCQGIIYSTLGEKDTAESFFSKYEELCPKELPGRSFLDNLLSRARKEGQKAYEYKLKTKGNA